MVNITLLLQKCSLFKNKTIDEIDGLLSKIDYRIAVFDEEEIILSPFQTANKLGIILSGIVDVQKLFPAGKVVIIERKKSPDLIGESSIFSRINNYSDTFLASRKCEILFLPKPEILKLFKLDNDLRSNILESVSNSTLVLKHKIGILSLNSIQEKIAGFLIHDNRHSNRANNSPVVELPFSKKAWAEYMNVSRTSLSRELRNLEKKGIISFNKRDIEIKDLKKLEKILSL